MEKVEYDPYASAVEPAHDEMARLRSRCPVAHTPSGYFVSTYEGVREVLQRVENYSGNFIDMSSFHEDELPLPNIDEPRHGVVRRVVNGAIARHRTAEVEPYIEELTRSLMEDVVAAARQHETVDLVARYTRQIPSRVIAKVLGVPVDDFDVFIRWADELVERIWANEPKPYAELHPEFAAYMQRLVDERRDDYQNERDVISRLMAAGMSDTAVVTNAIHLIIAGNETTRSMLGNTLYRLGRDPEMYKRLRENRDLIPAAIEESLRYDSPIQVMGRTARVDLEVAGETIPCGAHVIVGLASANRDSTVFEDPDEFRVDRPNPKEHVAFGAGPHICPGAFLARMEGHIALASFVDRVEAFALVDEHFDGNPLFWSRAPLSLRVTLTEAREKVAS